MNVSGPRLVAVIALAALTVAMVVPAVILLARGDGNTPIQIIAEPTNPPANSVNSELPPESLEIKVYVNGAVSRPGVYTLASGDRLVDALDAAGGAAEGADLDRINLALRVQDEGYYYVPTDGEAPPEVASDTALQASPSTSAALVDPGLINLNTASIDVLATLPGIGNGRAEAIVSHRTNNGPLSSVEEVTTISGIGSGTYQQIRDLVTVE